MRRTRLVSVSQERTLAELIWRLCPLLLQSPAESSFSVNRTSEIRSQQRASAPARRDALLRLQLAATLQANMSLADSTADILSQTVNQGANNHHSAPRGGQIFHIEKLMLAAARLAESWLPGTKPATCSRQAPKQRAAPGTDDAATADGFSEGKLMEADAS